MAELIGGLSWTAGASTTLSQAGGFARATATAAGTPPRITKGPVTLVSGVAYRFAGSMYLRTATPGPLYLRVSSTVGLAAGDYFQAQLNAGQLDLSTLNFIAGGSGTAYIGIVAVTTSIGEYSEIDAALTMVNGASTTDTAKLAAGGAGSIADASRLLIVTGGGALKLTNQQLKESGAGFWADMARQGGVVIP